MSRCLRAREAPHRDAADPVRAFRILVLPGDVVLSAGGQDLDLVPGREALGDQPAVVLGSAEDLGAVALNDKSYSHRNGASVSFSRASMRGGAKSCRRRRWPSSTRRAQVTIVYDAAQQLGGDFEIFRREQDSRPAERFRHRPGGIRDDRDVGGHRLDQRHAEALVLAERHVGVGPAIERREVLVRHRAGEPEPVRQHLVLLDQRPHLRVVAGQAVVAPDEDEPVVAVDVALVHLRQPDVILDLLVGDDPADEEDVDQPVAEDPLQRRPRRRAGDPRGVDGDRHDAGPLEAERLELLAVEVGIAERQVDVPRERRQLLAAERREPEESRIVGGEERRRRDVVVLQHLRAEQPREGLRHRRRQGEVEDRDVAPRRLVVGERQHVAAQVVVDGQREDVRVVPHPAQHPAHGPRAVADRVAAMRRRNPLVDSHRGSGIGDRGSGADGALGKAR